MCSKVIHPYRSVWLNQDGFNLINGEKRRMLNSVYNHTTYYHFVYVFQAAEEVDYIDISNFAQDQIGIIVKFRWMLEATLEDEPDEPDELDENE